MNKKILGTSKKLRIVTDISALFVLVAGIFGNVILGMSSPANAASYILYTSPSVQSVKKGESLSISIRYNPQGTAVNTLAFTASFDSTKLKLTKKSLSGVMNAVMIDSATASSVRFEGGKVPGSITSDSLIETLTFKAIANGAANINLSNIQSNRASDSTEVGVAGIGSTITISTPSTPKPPTEPVKNPPKTQDKPSKDTTKKSTDTDKDSTKDKTPAKKPATPAANAPRLSSSKLKIQFTTANIALTSDVQTTAYVLYGTGTPTKKTVVSSLAKTHSITIPSGQLQTGTTYNYTIVLTNSKGVSTKSQQMTFSTKGLPIRVQVLDGTGQPLKNTSVTIHSTPQTAKTDAKGYVTFEVAAGDHTLEYKDGGKTYTQRFVVANTIKSTSGVQNAAEQEFSVVFPVVHTNNILTYILIAIGVAGLIMLALIIVRMAKRSGANSQYAVVQNSWGSEAPRAIEDTPSYQQQPIDSSAQPYDGAATTAANAEQSEYPYGLTPSDAGVNTDTQSAEPTGDNNK